LLAVAVVEPVVQAHLLMVGLVEALLVIEATVIIAVDLLELEDLVVMGGHSLQVALLVLIQVVDMEMEPLEVRFKEVSELQQI
jgi:hypothetical protein